MLTFHSKSALFHQRLLSRFIMFKNRKIKNKQIKNLLNPLKEIRNLQNQFLFDFQQNSEIFYLINIIKQSMSDINNSLIGFLQKKSLFTESPDKNNKRRSRSKDKLQLNRSMRDQGSKTVLNTGRRSEELEDDMPNLMIFKKEESIKKEDSYKKEKVQRNFNFKNSDKKEEKRVEEKEVKKETRPIISTGAPTSFESARLESAQCLQNLSTKIRNQISNINYKVDNFEKKMKDLLEKELKAVHQTINQLVNQIFEENYRNIKNHIKKEEQVLAKELFIMKKHLQGEYQRVDYMKEEIKKPNWRKIAGELLSSDLENTIEQAISQSSKLQIRDTQVYNYDEKKLKNFEYSLRNLMKLQENQGR